MSVIKELDKKIKAGTDQTIINYLTQQNNIQLEYMPECYNLQDLSKKNLLRPSENEGYTTIDSIKNHWKPNFLKAGWIYHFNAITQEDKDIVKTMSRTIPDIFKEEWMATTYNFLNR